MTKPGRLLGLGDGPGDPELITVKALRLLRAAPVIGYLSAKGKKSNAFSIIEAHVRPEQVLLPLIYPVTTEHLPAPMSYVKVIADFNSDSDTGQLTVFVNGGVHSTEAVRGDTSWSFTLT